MYRVITIDPGKSKCGLVLAEISEKKVYKAIILKSELLENYVRNLITVEDISKIIIGNGTTSREIKEKLYFFKKEIITFEEKNTTFRAKARYFELFPISGLKFLLPREVFIKNKNLPRNKKPQTTNWEKFEISCFGSISSIFFFKSYYFFF